jgi:hypothetical protein
MPLDDAPKKSDSALRRWRSYYQDLLLYKNVSCHYIQYKYQFQNMENKIRFTLPEPYSYSKEHKTLKIQNELKLNRKICEP